MAGSAGLQLMFPIGLAITGLLVIVALSYFQTIPAYPSGGGSYVVAKENLGILPGLVAGSALMIGYLLTAAVSLTSGVETIASAFPLISQHKVIFALILLALITLMNLRGIQETGSIMSMPVYLFLFVYFPLLGYGFIQLFLHGSVPPAVKMTPVPISWFCSCIPLPQGVPP